MRHGESTANSAGIVQGRGHGDRSPLTDKGQSQAVLIGKALADLEIDVAYCSPLMRAHQTANLILSDRPISPNLHAHLQEINLPQWEGLTFAEVQFQYPEQYHNWHHAPEQLVMVLPSGDRFYPVLDLFAQAQQMWSEILANHQGQTILLIAHSGINRALIATALGISPSRYHFLYQSNCGISILNFQANSKANFLPTAQLESLNLISHLQAIAGNTLPPQKGKRLLLVRHGETNWNRDQRFQGQIDVPLNDHGKTQAHRAADFLAKVKIDRAVSSSMVRPKETAEIILQNHPQVILQLADLLKEISHGQWEGKLESEIRTAYADELQRWQTQPETVQMPNGENLEDVWSRVRIAWQEIIDALGDGETALVVAHDAVNKAILCQLFELTPASFWAFKQGNGCVSVIDYHNVPVLQAMNITTHLSASVLDKTAAGAL